MLALIGGWFIWRGAGGPRATRIVTILAAVGIGINLFSIGQFALGMSARSEATTSAAVDIDPASTDRPDVYYFIFDRFASAETLREHFGYDLTPFLDALRERGFYVAEDSWANYLKTPLSLMSRSTWSTSTPPRSRPPPRNRATRHRCTPPSASAPRAR